MCKKIKNEVTDVFSELKYIKHKLSAILKRHSYHGIQATQFFGTFSDSSNAVFYNALSFTILTNKRCAKY